MSDNQFHDKREYEEIEKDKKKTWTMSIRINADEKEMLRQLRKMLNLDMDSTAFKVSARIGYNVLQAFFGAKILKYISDGRRRRYIQEE